MNKPKCTGCDPAGGFCLDCRTAERAAAPAVAITQAATSDMCNKIMRLPCNVPRDAWEFSYKAGHRDALAAAAELAAPGQHCGYCSSMGYESCAHLAGTTPNTEAPSDVVAALRNIRDYRTDVAPDVAAPAMRFYAEQALAALSAQQAGVQEAPSEDAKEVQRLTLELQNQRELVQSWKGKAILGADYQDAKRYRWLRDHCYDTDPAGEGDAFDRPALHFESDELAAYDESSLDVAIDAALAAATQTEKK